MSAQSPEEICSFFQRYMAAGDLDSVLSLYEREAVFLNASGEMRRGEQELRRELAPMAEAQTQFDFKIRQIIHAGDIALMHTDWTITSGQELMSVFAIEVARRQADGSWRWLIGDPFTVGRRVTAQT